MYGYAYKKGNECDVNDDLAQSLSDRGVVRIIGESPKEVYDDPGTVELPLDVPYRDELIEAGITIFEQLKDIKDYRKIRGIGPAKAKAIEGYFRKTIHTR